MPSSRMIAALALLALLAADVRPQGPAPTQRALVEVLADQSTKPISRLLTGAVPRGRQP